MKPRRFRLCSRQWSEQVRRGRAYDAGANIFQKGTTIERCHARILADDDSGFTKDLRLVGRGSRRAGTQSRKESRLGGSLALPRLSQLVQTALLLRDRIVVRIGSYSLSPSRGEGWGEGQSAAIRCA